MVIEDKTYEVCKCGFNPALNEKEFDVLYSEYGMLEKVLIKSADAVCKTCGEKFKFEKVLC